MAYKALLNGNIFFETDGAEKEYILTKAVLKRATDSAGSFNFTIPPQNEYYGQFHRLTDYVDVYRDNNLLFSGRVYSIGKSFDTQQVISCEGLLTIFNDSVVRPMIFDGLLHDLITNLIDNHNSQVEAEKQIRLGTITIPNSNCYRAYQNYESTISRLQNLCSSFGGWIRVRRGINGELYFDWFEQNQQGVDQFVDFGENLLDIKQEANADGIITCLIPLGAEDDDGVRLTIESVNGGLDYITASQEYLNKYGYIFGVQIWNDVNLPNILKTKGENYLDARLVPQKTINLTAVDMADAGYEVEAFDIGQMIQVNSKPHGLEREFFACNKQDLDLLIPANNKLNLGTLKIGYIKAEKNANAALQFALEQIVAKYASKSFLEQAVEQATQLISGNSGGNIVLHDSDGDGEPDELLIMDTSDINTAVKVWRFNNAGLGYSSNGYAGPYGLAMTMNGAIVADYITTGTLNANLIKAGQIKSTQSSSYWDLTTGKFYVSSATITGAIDIRTSASTNDYLQLRQGNNWFIYTNGFLSIRETDPTTGRVVSESLSGKNFMQFNRMDSNNVSYKDFSIQLSGNNTKQILMTLGSHRAVSGEQYSYGVLAINSQNSYGTSIQHNESTEPLTSSRVLYLPDKSGTIAIRAEIPHLSTGSTSGAISVTVNGTTSSVPVYGLGTAAFTNSGAYAAASHSHAYLPLTGGTLTGTINTKAIIAEDANIAINTTSADAHYLRLGNSGNYKRGYIMMYPSANVSYRHAIIPNESLTANSSSTLPLTSGTLANTSSSATRYKKDISYDIDKEFDPHKLLDLKMAQFKFKDDQHLQYLDQIDLLQVGFLAEDVAKIYPVASVHETTQDSQIESWDERRILPPMLALIQEMYNDLQNIKKEVFG